MQGASTQGRGFAAGILRGLPALEHLAALGDLAILRRPALGLLCSGACPGQLALRAHDLASSIAWHGPAVVSGFHSPVEAACLGVLLRGAHPVVWCLARRLDPASLDPLTLGAAAAGRLLVLSGCAPSARCGSRRQALERNLLVAALARRLLVVYATPGGSAERCAAEAAGKLLTFQAAENTGLFALGAHSVAEGPPGAARPGYGAVYS